MGPEPLPCTSAKAEDPDPYAHLIHNGSKMPARCRCTVYGDAEICFSSEFTRTQSVCRGHSSHFLRWRDEESGSAFPGSPANLEPRAGCLFLSTRLSVLPDTFNDKHDENLLFKWCRDDSVQHGGAMCPLAEVAKGSTKPRGFLMVTI